MLCRFLPIVRTLVPFVAGMARMEFHRYLAFAALAAALWVTIFLGAGYLFGNIQWVQDYLARRAGDRRRGVGHPRLHHLGRAPPAAAVQTGMTGRHRPCFPRVRPRSIPRSQPEGPAIRCLLPAASIVGGNGATAGLRTGDQLVTAHDACERMLAPQSLNGGYDDRELCRGPGGLLLHPEPSSAGASGWSTSSCCWRSPASSSCSPPTTATRAPSSPGSSSCCCCRCSASSPTSSSGATSAATHRGDARSWRRWTPSPRSR